MGFRLFWRDVRVHRRYWIAAAMVFAVGLYMGAAHEGMFQRYLADQLRLLQEIGRVTDAFGGAGWLLFLVIFFNNAIKSLLVIGLGAGFALFPLFFLVANGVVIGYLVAHPAPGVTAADLAAALLPHGVIEIPAILLAAGYGIRLGWITGRALLLFPVEAARKRAVEEFRAFFAVAPALVVVVIMALLAAAVVESTVTLWLVREIEIGE